MRKELIWSVGLLIVFLLFLIITGEPEFSDLTLIVVAYTINWVIISYNLKRIGTHGADREMMWFGGLLIIFLCFLVIVGSPKYPELVIATAAFTFVWIVRSYLASKFVKKAEN